MVLSPQADDYERNCFTLESMTRARVEVKDASDDQMIQHTVLIYVPLDGAATWRNEHVLGQTIGCSF
jgi:hypothetical protein